MAGPGGKGSDMVSADSPMTWGQWYWPCWMILVAVTFFPPEFYALATSWRNTYSNWVWTDLGVVPGQTWTAVHVLVFGLWIVVGVWLTGHFFWRLWT